METDFVECMRNLSVLVNQTANGTENLKLYEDIRDVAKRISDMVDAKDSYTKGHSERKAYYAASIALELGFGNREIEVMKISTLLHDIGKIGIGEELLQKPGKLNNLEFKTVKKHSLISERILIPVGFSGQVLSAIRSHHESPNGKGYPDGLCEDEIPIEASIIKVVDAFAAMISDRPYRPVLSFQDALRQLKDSSGTEFDSKIVSAFQQIVELEEKRRMKEKTTTTAKRILVGDGDIVNANLIIFALEKEGFNTLCAYMGEDVLEKVYSHYPDIMLLNATLPDISVMNICRRFKSDPRSTYIPIITFGAKDVSEEIKMLESGVEGHITNIFDSKKVISQIKAYLRRTDHEKGLDPLTGLPGNFFIKEEIKKRINEKFAVIFPDLDNLRAFNKVYGFFQGDEVIKLTAKIIDKTIKKIGNPTDFIGHRGGDEFIAITSPDKIDDICQEIISCFDKEITSLYLPEDISKGYITCQEEDKSPSIYPIMTISIGVVTNQEKKFDNYFQVHKLALEAKEEAKALPGSSYYKKGLRI